MINDYVPLNIFKKRMRIKRRTMSHWDCSKMFISVCFGISMMRVLQCCSYFLVFFFGYKLFLALPFSLIIHSFRPISTATKRLTPSHPTMFGFGLLCQCCVRVPTIRIYSAWHQHYINTMIWENFYVISHTHTHARINESIQYIHYVKLEYVTKKFLQTSRQQQHQQQRKKKRKMQENEAKSGEEQQNARI